MPIKYQKISNEGKIEGPVFFDNGKYSTNYASSPLLG